MKLEEARTNNPEHREIIDATNMMSVEPEYALGMTPDEREEADRISRAAYDEFLERWRAQPWYVKWWRRLGGENPG